MTEDYKPSHDATPIPGEQLSLADIAQFEELFRLLAVPPLAGYTPAAITAVAIMVSPTGEVAHYPLYAQILGTELSEMKELRAAIEILRRWLRAQGLGGPRAGTR